MYYSPRTLLTSRPPKRKKQFGDTLVSVWPQRGGGISPFSSTSMRCSWLFGDFAWSPELEDVSDFEVEREEEGEEEEEEEEEEDEEGEVEKTRRQGNAPLLVGDVRPPLSK